MKYTVELDFEVHSCLECPFLRQNRYFDSIPKNQNVLSSVTGIEREEFSCGIKDKKLDYIIHVGDTECPLKKGQ